MSFCLFGCKQQPPDAPPESPPPDVSANRDETPEVTAEGDLTPSPGGAPAGRWRRFRTHRFDAGLSEAQREALGGLESVGYVAGSVEAGELAGVTIHDADAAFAGLNFYSSGHAAEATLMDMSGRVLHRWRYPFERVWPDYPLPKGAEKKTQFWRKVHLYENGDILAIYEGLGIVKLDKDSKLLWENPCKAHHDLHVMPDGDIYTLTREARIVPEISQTHPVLEDFVSVLGPDGVEKRRVSVLRCAMNSGLNAEKLAPLAERNGDVFHTNAVEVLDGRLAQRVPAFAAGNVLTSLRNVNQLAVLDLDRQRVVWMHADGFRAQHDPRLLPDGNLLLFDNAGRPRQSAVLELDPQTRRLVWEYRGTPEAPFYSLECGTAQRLPNGNTLITESDNGRAFEVTRDKRIVWEFHSPHRAGDDNEFVATLFEVERLPADFPIDWAEHPSGREP